MGKEPDIEFKEITLKESSGEMLTAQQLAAGPVISPAARISLYSPAEWETFTEEWAFYCLPKLYKKVRKAPGANDKGVDVAGFRDAKMLKGVWDNYQCKHYDHPLRPTDVWVELGKIIWYSFRGDYKAPRDYYFIAPREVGTSLAHLLGNVDKLKEELLKNWDKYCRDEITSTQLVPMEGAFADHVQTFDFLIFKSKSILEILEQFKKSPTCVTRFGGGLPKRPKVGKPPEDVTQEESIYVGELLKAYGDHLGQAVPDKAALVSEKKLNDHFKRQREAFYHAESLRVFVRDKVEPGTFESLQEEIFHGVVDTSEAAHADGYACVVAVTQAAHELPIDAHPLAPSTVGQDKRGICHQLANDERLKWTK
jgi:hypothetical protein